MDVAQETRTTPSPRSSGDPVRFGPSPFGLRIEPIARFLNCELVDDPHYDGLEVQWFDDPLHGSGLLVFLSLRADRRVDFYIERGLRLDPAMFSIGAGVGAWTETRFEQARLAIADDGVDAAVRFTDVAGRRIEIRVDDRDGRRRRRSALLAPVGAATDDPQSLLLVHLRGFDLVRTSKEPPVVRIDGRVAATGRLPGQALHHRHLVKYAGPLAVAQVNPVRDGAPADTGGDVTEQWADDALVGLAAEQAGHRAWLRFRPGVPDLAGLVDGEQRDGRWTIEVDGTRLTGGTWDVRRSGGTAHVTMAVTERWQPGRLPLLMRIVTTVMPTFRQWPTTYRWSATVPLAGHGVMTAAWERTSDDRGDAYRRTTGA